MARLAVRKSRKKSASTKTRKTVSKKIGVVSNKLYIQRIESYLNNVDRFIKARIRRYGKNDIVAKRLLKAKTAVRSELRKQNVVNPKLIRSLQNLKKGFVGVSGVPAAIRGYYPKAATFIRNHVRKDVVSFINSLKSFLSPIERDLYKLQTRLQRELSYARKGSKHFSIDSSIKSKFVSLNKKLTSFNKKWGKFLTQFNTHGNPQVKSSIKALRKQIADLKKVINKNITTINQISKSSVKSRGKVRSQNLLTKSEAESFHRKWIAAEKKWQGYRTQFANYAEQLKAVKLF